MNCVAWRGANGHWTKWHFERDEYPYSLYCRASVASDTITIRRKLVGLHKVCKECRQNLYEELKHEDHSAH